MVALDSLMACLDDRQPLDHVLDRDRRFAALEPRDRALVRTLTSQTCRRLGQIDDLLASCLDRPLPAKERTARAILRLGAVQLLFLDFAAHAAVDTSVRLAHARAKGLVPFVNAVLRRLQREGPSRVAAQEAGRLNTPDWLFRSWEDAYGASAAHAIARAHLERAALDISVIDDAERWAARLGARILPTGGLRLPSSGAVSELPGYGCGRWWVQDAAASLPARLLGDVAGKDVLDLCAAPGGKTAQLAAAGARVTALDRSEERMKTLGANMKRLRLGVRTVIADALAWQCDSRFDAVLLDAPCSGTGAIRRHPDILRTKTGRDPARLAGLQERLIGRALAHLKPGGVLVYSVCSLQREEGEAHLASLPGGCRLDPVGPEEVGGLAEIVSRGGTLRTLPVHLGSLGGLDGFFAMRLRRGIEAGTSIP